MSNALEAVNYVMSQLDSSKKFMFPRTTLLEKIHRTHVLKPGRPTVQTQEEEALIAKSHRTVSDWGFPMTQEDVCQIISKSTGRRLCTLLCSKEQIKYSLSNQ